jgi:hypothetical protein
MRKWEAVEPRLKRDTVETVKRLRSLVAILAVLGGPGAAIAFNLWPHSLPRQPNLYRVVGYLDEAPKNTVARDRITIHAPGRADREMLVIEYQTPGETPLDMELSRALGRRYGLMGPKAEVAKFLDIPKGEQFIAVFLAYTDGPPSLYVADLEYPVEPATDE